MMLGCCIMTALVGRIIVTGADKTYLTKTDIFDPLRSSSFRPPTLNVKEEMLTRRENSDLEGEISVCIPSGKSLIPLHDTKKLVMTSSYRVCSESLKSTLQEEEPQSDGADAIQNPLEGHTGMFSDFRKTSGDADAIDNPLEGHTGIFSDFRKTSGDADAIDNPLEDHTGIFPDFRKTSGRSSLLSTIDSVFKFRPLWSNLSRSSGSEDTAASVRSLLIILAYEEFRDCDNIIVVDKYYWNFRVLEEILWIENLKQILLVKESDEIENNFQWKSARCRGLVFLMAHPGFLFKFGDRDMAAWDYNARVIIAGLSKEDLDVFIKTQKAKKTEQIIGIVKGETEGHLKIYTNELYWGRRGVVKIADWRKGLSLQRRPDLFPDKVSDLRQVVLNVTTFEFPPAIMYHRASNGTVLLRYGLDIAVMETLSRVFNFSILFKEPPPGELWGEKLPNGTWTGMIGLLGSGQADFSLANLYITALLGRREFQEFSSPYTSDKSCIITRTGQPLPLWQSPTLPFKQSTWIALLFGVVLSGPVLALLGKASAHMGEEDANFQSLMFSALFTYGVHLHHPMGKLPFRPATKVFVAFLWFYGLILTIAYSSNLIAFLTIKRDPPSMDTFSELEKSRLRILGLGPFFRNSMAQSENEYLRALAERFQSLSTIDEAKPEILSGRAVMINSRSTLKFYISQITTTDGRPLTRLMKECFSPYHVGLGYQSHSPLKPKFDRMITRMLESGLTLKWFQESLQLHRKLQRQDSAERGDSIPAESNSQLQDTGVIPLATDHLQGIFIVYLFGILVSGNLFLLERLVFS